MATSLARSRGLLAGLDPRPFVDDEFLRHLITAGGDEEGRSGISARPWV
jgi:hypothetical protein